VLVRVAGSFLASLAPPRFGIIMSVIRAAPLLLLLPLLLALVVVPGSRAAVNYSFNETLADECRNASTPCSFANETLWIPTGVPSTNDTATINITSGSPVQISISSPITIVALTLNNAAIVISAQSSLISLLRLSNSSATVVGNSTLESDFGIALNSASVLTLQDGADLFTYSELSDIEVDASSELRVYNSAVVNWVGGTLYLYGILDTDINAQVYFEKLVFSVATSAHIRSPLNVGLLIVPNNTVVTFTTLLNGGVQVGQNAQLLFSNSTFIGAIRLPTETSTATFTNGSYAHFSLDEDYYDQSAIAGVGSLNILSSKVRVTGVGSGLFNGSFFLGGVVEASFHNVSLVTLNFTNGDHDEPPSATIYAENFTITSYAFIFGNVYPTGLQGFTIAGLVIIAGTLSATSSAINVPGNLVALNNFFVQNSSITLGGTLHANFELTTSSTLTVSTAVASIIGSVTNNGIIDIASDRVLQIWSGDYTQGNTALHVTLDKEAAASLDVLNGSIVLGNESTLAFNIQDKPFLTSASFLVARASVNGTINGTFFGDAAPFANSKINRKLGVNIDNNANTISIRYNFNAADVDAWVWAVFAVSVTAVIAIIAFVIFRVRRRRAYQKVASNF